MPGIGENWDLLGGINKPARVQQDQTGFQNRMAGFDASAAPYDDALGLAGVAARGGAPSAAYAQQQAGMQQAAQLAGAQAASARGNYGLAQGQMNAVQQGAQIGQNAALQGGMLRAQEMAQAREQYMQGALQNRMAQLQAAGLSEQEARDRATTELQSNNQQIGVEQYNRQAGIDTLKGGMDAAEKIIGLAAL